MKTIIIDYPIDFQFRTKKTFNNLDEMTDYIRTRLSKIKYDSFHSPSDFIVEDVEKLDDNLEFWILGS